MSSRVCKHGQLGRACPFCELEEEELAEKAKTIAVLERMVEVLRKDAERLDYIERNWFYRDAFGELTFIFNESWSAGVHETLRDAIDAEINKASAGGGTTGATLEQ